MSEQTPAPATGAENNPPATQPATTTEPPQGVPPEAWAALGDPGKKAIAAEREARETAERNAAALQAQIDEIAKANLSDLERAQKDAEEARTAAANATTEALRYRLAAKHGISDEDAKFLNGTEAEMTALAERLAAANASAPRTPAPDPTQGGTGTPPGGTPEGDFQNFISQQLGARA